MPEMGLLIALLPSHDAITPLRYALKPYVGLSS